MLSRIFLLSLTIPCLSLAMESGPHAFGNPEQKKEEEITKSIKTTFKDIFNLVAGYTEAGIPVIGLFLKKQLLNKYIEIGLGAQSNNDYIYQPTISPDKKLLIYGLHDKTIKIVDLENKSEEKEMPESYLYDILGFEFTPDNNFLLIIKTKNNYNYYLLCASDPLTKDYKITNLITVPNDSCADYNNALIPYTLIQKNLDMILTKPIEYSFTTPKQIKESNNTYNILKKTNLEKIFYVDTYLQNLSKSTNPIKRTQFLLIADLKQIAEQNKQLTLHTNDGYYIAYNLLPENIRSALAHLVVVIPEPDQNKN